MKKNIIILVVGLMVWVSCADLDVIDPNEPSNESFFTAEVEIEAALVGAYNTVIWLGGQESPMQVSMDNGATDIGVVRGNFFGYDDLSQGTLAASTSGYQRQYEYLYSGVVRANAVIENLPNVQDISVERAAEIEAEALTLRAYFYHYLIELFGNVPYHTESNLSSTAFLPRTPKADIVTTLLAELASAAEVLPNTPAATGRVSKNFALGLRARIALYAGDFAEAAKSAGEVIANGDYDLHPSYQELFANPAVMGSGLNPGSNNEIMFVMPFADGFVTTQFPRAQGSRNRNAFCTVNPTQAMIDSYEATDGLPIDESAVYDPTQPFENRDPRLKASIVTPGAQWTDLIFESHVDSTTRLVPSGNRIRQNDSPGGIWAASLSGYIWRKYTDEEAQAQRRIWSENHFSLMRFAEILLIYAEAKIESGEIDASVLSAINRVRARAYGVSEGDIGSYPAISNSGQAELRKVIRRERKVELANEGFRLFDIRRWRIGQTAMAGPGNRVYSRLIDFANTTAASIPEIDDNCVVTYNNVDVSQYFINEIAFGRPWNDNFPRQFLGDFIYLLPIPQSEIDVYNANGVTLGQNEGY